MTKCFLKFISQQFSFQSSQLATNAFYFVDEKDMQLPDANIHITLTKSGGRYFVGAGR